MISLLVTLLVAALVMGLFWYILTLLPLPEPFGQLVRVVFMIICVLILISILLGGVSFPLHAVYLR